MSTIIKKPYLVKSHGRTAHEVRMDISGSDWHQDFLLTADRHLDNADSDRDIQLEQLQEAKERNAGVIDFGDIFDAMQGNGDKRSSKSKMRVEDKESAYLDALVNNAAKFLEPHSKQFVMISQGNHETAILKHHETDLIERLVTKLNDRTGSKIIAGGYSNFIRFQFRNSTQSQSLDLFGFHGSGGGGAVTKGVIQTNRRAAAVGADIYVSGHVHESWAIEIPRTQLTKQYKVEHKQTWHIQLPSYKEEFKDGFGGYHVENGRPAKPIGAWWLRFYYSQRDRRVMCEPIKAR